MALILCLDVRASGVRGPRRWQIAGARPRAPRTSRSRVGPAATCDAALQRARDMWAREMAHEHPHRPRREPAPEPLVFDASALALLDLRADPLSLDEVVRAVQHPSAGGIATFLGVVRDHNEGRAVTRLDYEAYAPMAVRELRRIATGIAAELPGTRLAALHRVGELSVGDAAIVCAVSAPHRAEAFEGCRALIDRIKADVPIWKREHGPDGAYWVGWRDARCTGEH